MLRRDEDEYGSQTTYDGQFRHTVDIGLGRRFQRGAPYRSSLQNLNPSTIRGEHFFIRNNRLRSTILPATTIDAATPVFRSRYDQATITRGSSQLSVNSTNPFDEYENETMSQIESPERSSLARRSARKKGRAPQPPILVSILIL